MTNPIVGQCALYVVQMVFTAHVMRVLIEKVLCMCLVGLLWVLYYYTIYYVCVLFMHVRDSTYRVMDQNIYCTLFDCL